MRISRLDCLIDHSYFRRDFFFNTFVDTFGAPFEDAFFLPLEVTPFGVKSDNADSSILYRMLPRSICFDHRTQLLGAIPYLFLNPPLFVLKFADAFQVVVNFGLSDTIVNRR